MLFETKIWGPLFLTGHAQCSQLVAIPSLFSADRLEGENGFILCVPSCVHTRIDIHIYTYFYISTFVCWNVYSYIHISNSSPIRVISLAFCLSLYSTPSPNKKPGLFWAYSVSHPDCKESLNFTTCGGGGWGWGCHAHPAGSADTFLPGCSVSMPSSSCSTLTTPHSRPPSLTPSSPYWTQTSHWPPLHGDAVLNPWILSHRAALQGILLCPPTRFQTQQLSTESAKGKSRERSEAYRKQAMLSFHSFLTYNTQRRGVKWQDLALAGFSATFNSVLVRTCVLCVCNAFCCSSQIMTKALHSFLPSELTYFPTSQGASRKGQFG